MKKIFLTETEKQRIIAEREKAIMESFAKTYNKIKRIDENEISSDISEASVEESSFDSTLEKSLMKGFKASVKEEENTDENEDLENN